MKSFENKHWLTRSRLSPLMLAFCCAGFAMAAMPSIAQTESTTTARDELKQSLQEATRAAKEGVDAAKKALRAASEELKAQSNRAQEKTSDFEQSIQRLVSTSLATAATALEATAKEIGPEVERAIAQVDIDEIRDTVRRALDDAERSSGYSFRMSTRDTAEKGNPYSAKETREFKQTLSDGTVISRTSVRVLTRDSEGRTRQELRQPDGTSRIYINDPVAKRAHIVDPQRRAACTAKFDSDSINDCLKQMRGDWTPLGFNFTPGRNGIPIMTSRDDVTFNVRPEAKVIDLTENNGAWSGRSGVFSYSASGQGAVAVSPGAIVVAPATPNTAPATPNTAPTPPSPPSNVRGSRVVREKNTTTHEGLKVEHERTVETIPAGTMGNNRPIEIVNERFFSPDLKMTVFSKRSDPRSGEFIYRMTDVKRSEPDASMFKVPSGFTESEGKSR